MNCPACDRDYLICIANPCDYRKRYDPANCSVCGKGLIGLPLACPDEFCGYKKRYDPLKRNCVIDSIVSDLVCPDCGGYNSSQYKEDLYTCTECGQFMVGSFRVKPTHKPEGESMPDRIIILNGVSYFSEFYLTEVRKNHANAMCQAKAALDVANEESTISEANATVLSSSLVRTTMGNFLRLDLVEKGRTPGCAPNVLFAPGHRISVRTVDDE